VRRPDSDVFGVSATFTSMGGWVLLLTSLARKTMLGALLSGRRKDGFQGFENWRVGEGGQEGQRVGLKDI
jgi:hypothetical protein